LRLLGASKAFENILLRYCVQVSVSALCGLWVTKRGVHCEPYIRKTPASSWALDMATEDRWRAISAAEDALKEKRAVSVRVTKETLDDATREFRVVTILTKGAAETPKPKARPTHLVAPPWLWRGLKTPRSKCFSLRFDLM